MPQIDRTQFDVAAARRLDRLSKKHRKQLLDYLGDPPRFENVPEKFWAEVDAEMQRHLAIILFIIFTSTAAHWGMDDDDIEDVGESWANERAQWTSIRYAMNSRDRLAGFFNRGKEFKGDDLREYILGIFGPARTTMVGTTENTRAITAGTVEAAKRDPRYAEGKVGIYWRLGPNENHCPFCNRVADTESAFWSQFIDGPPVHPHCQCWLDIIASDRKLSPTLPNFSELVSSAAMSGITESAFLVPERFLIEARGYDDEDGHWVTLPSGIRVFIRDKSAADEAWSSPEELKGKIVVGVRQPKQLEEWKQRLGLKASNQQLARVNGALDGSTVRLLPGSQGIHMETHDDRYRTVNVIRRDGNELIVENLNFRVNERARGLGAEILKSQIDAARRVGAKRIVVYAIGNWALRDKTNGYYTWPRLGFDAELPEDWQKRMQANGLGEIPDKLKDAKRVSDFFKLENGRHLWKRFGFPMEMSLDLRSGSQGSRVFNTYYKSTDRAKAVMRQNAADRETKRASDKAEWDTAVDQLLKI